MRSHASRRLFQLVAIMALFGHWNGNAWAGDAPCDLEWSDVGGGTDGIVYALAEFDPPGDGPGLGAALIAGGNFTMAGGVAANRIAKWDGQQWSPLSEGVAFGGGGGTVRALTVFDDGSGPALIVAGSFSIADDILTGGIARWDGDSWSALTDPEFAINGVLALTVFDDGLGGGPALYAASNFNVYRYTGKSFEPLGVGFDDHNVNALEVFDDGSGGGPALYAGGQFTLSGGLRVNHVAKWNGASWEPLDQGIDVIEDCDQFGECEIVSAVRALITFDDGLGPGSCLYCGGEFETAAGDLANGIASWNGECWSTLAGGFLILAANLRVYLMSHLSRHSMMEPGWGYTSAAPLTG
jgi:hypothetical protein